MEGRFAVKRLVAVEIRPDRSHQHEFHAGRLRTGLGFGGGTTKGRLQLLIYTGDLAEPVADEDAYTLYDARETTPGRSEWHLYYYSKQLPDFAEPGDLLVLYRPSGNLDLHGVVLRAGSSREDRLLDALMLRNEEVLAEFRLMDAPTDTTRSAGVAEALALPLADDPGATAAWTYPTRDHPVVKRAIAEGSIPLTRTMAGAATGLVGIKLASTDPDTYLTHAMEVETRLFFEIEGSLGGARLAQLREQNAPLDAVLDWAMTIHQARRSRRGQSLQHHFEVVLQACEIPYSAQCPTELGETPDFLVPGCDAYHDSHFPGERLRMIACKTTSKERWRQVLNEARRIHEKYLLTLDRSLTAQAITQMRASGLRPFLPASIVAADYAANPARSALGSVSGLIEELRSSTA